MKKRLVEAFITGVVVFDAVGYWAYHLPVWPFVPMWFGAMAEIEVGWFAVSRLLKLAPIKLHLHARKPLAPGRAT